MDNIMNEKLLEIGRAFGIEGELTSTSQFTSGHINSTYLAEFKSGEKSEKYLIQKINVHVFKDPDILMDNITGVTNFLRKKIAEKGGDPDRETLTFLSAKNGKYYYNDGKEFWRIYHFVDNTFTYDFIENAEAFEDSGRSFGRFQNLLKDYPSESLKETIPDFHNTPKRIENLENAVKEDVANRVKEVQEEISFALSRKERAGEAMKMLKNGELPLRVTHNDTKINNILFDNKTKKGICVIDLDTIMPGLSLYDFGDAIRSGAATAPEDGEDLSKVGISLERYESYIRGYLSSCADSLTQKEVDKLPYSAWLMTFECGVRFLTDYIQNDIYFKIGYPNHNLVRARNQFQMVRKIEENEAALCDITKRVYNEVTGK